MGRRSAKLTIKSDFDFFFFFFFNREKKDFSQDELLICPEAASVLQEWNCISTNRE